MKRGPKPCAIKYDGAIRSLAALGKSMDEIAAFVGCSYSTIWKYCAECSIHTIRPAPNAQHDRNRQLCDSFLIGKTLQAVGEEFGITRERVRQILNANGISERYQWTIANNGTLDCVRDFYEAGEPWEVIEKEVGRTMGSLRGAYTPTKASKEKRRIAEFWRQVAVSVNEDRCWVWTGNVGPGGHGRCSWKGRNKSSHVVAFMLSAGKPSAQWVLHDCDNPPCCNPKHLYEGTAQDNMRDRDARGRGAHQNGKKVCDNWLVIEEVERIRALLDEGVPQMEIARIVGASFVIVNRINTGKSWSNPKPVQALPTPTFRAIYEGLAANAFTQAYVSRFYGLSPNTVQSIKKGDHWRVKKLFAESQNSA